MGGGSVRWTGFADLTFAESAHLAFAKAVDHAATDAHEHRPDAWVIEDRRIGFSAEVEAGLPELEGTKRLLRALTLQAIAGEAAIEVEMPPERWVVRAGAPSISKELVVGSDDDEGSSETIRTAAS